MKRIALVTSLAFALTTTAFAQDNSQTNPASSSSSSQAASADTQPASPDTSSDSQQPAPAPKRHHRHRSYNPAAMALTGNEPKDVAYQTSGQMKSYPAVDHGHVPGDPPVIDHSADQSAVTPTSSKITVPPNQ